MEGYLVRTLLAFAILSLFNHINPCTATLLPNEPNTDFIRTSCKVTLHPILCYNSLKDYACKIQTDPKLLAYTAVNVTLEFTKQSLATVKRFQEIGGLNPVLASTMEACANELTVAMDDIQNSKEGLEDHVTEGSDPKLEMGNTQAWLNAGLTIEQKCFDGFAVDHLDGKVETLTRRNIMKVAHLTSNAVQLLNHYALSKVTYP